MENKLTPREITERDHAVLRRVHSSFRNGREVGRQEILDKLESFRDKEFQNLADFNVIYDLFAKFIKDNTPTTEGGE